LYTQLCDRLAWVQVKQQIEDIDRLNGIVSAVERDMLQLKRQYEVRQESRHQPARRPLGAVSSRECVGLQVAVERRNYAGIQLIDRNDELCILYEKSNVHEATIAKGNVS
jgi:hypothetical protein